MKNALLTIIALTSLALTLTVDAADQTLLEHATQSVKQTTTNIVETAQQAIASTNINGVVVDILRGVKDAGSEIYGTTKSTIAKAVEFTVEQAPLVVQEFLRWKLAESIMWIFLSFIPVALLFYTSSRADTMMNLESTPDTDGRVIDKSDCFLAKWITRIVAILILTFAIGINGFTILKISLAPRVYLIEYVADSVKTIQR